MKAEQILLSSHTLSGEEAELKTLKIRHVNLSQGDV
jgi:hypothetical protein